jgi:hypothetical protein
MAGGPRHLAGRVVIAGMAAAVMGGAAAAAVAATGFATPAPMPPRGVSSDTKVPPGPSWLDAGCLASALDGGNWVLASGTGYPWRLIHVTAAGYG